MKSSASRQGDHIKRILDTLCGNIVYRHVLENGGKKHVKKTIILLTVLILAYAAAACKSPAEKTLITVGFAQCWVDESDWRRANTNSMMDHLSKANGFDLIIADSANDAQKQVSDVQNFIDQQVDYIVIAAVKVDGWDTVLKNAKSAGIPVILMDRTIEVEDKSLYITWTGGDFYNEGKMAVDWLKEFARDKALKLVMLQGQPGSSAEMGRSRALMDVLDANHWTLLASQASETWDTDEAKRFVTSWISQFKDDMFDVVYAQNDGMAYGAIQALEEAGYPVGGSDGIIIISFDANRWALELVLGGKINCDVECNPMLGPKIAEIIWKLHNGETVLKEDPNSDEAIFDFESIIQNIINARSY